MAVSEQVGARTAALIAEREQWISASVATAPVFVERAHGARLVDVDGREYIDFVGGIGTLNGGHTPERVVRSIHTNPAYVGERYGVRNANNAMVSRRGLKRSTGSTRDEARAG